MPDSTKFSRFHLPRDGEQAPPDGTDGPLQSVSDLENWGDTLQTDLDLLEEECPMIGADADKPDPAEGLNLYYATDTEVWYYNDGSTWTQNPSGGGGASNSVSNLSVTNWNLVDLGNEGYDGSGSKDLSDVFSKYGSNTIYILPEGTYRMSAGIQDTNSFEYVGFIGRPHATIDVVDNSSDYCFLFGGTTVDSKRVFLKNIDVDITGTDASGLDIDRGLIYGSITDYAEIENVRLIGARHRWQDIDGDGTLEKVGGRETVLLNALNEDTVVRYTNVKLPDGAIYESSQNQVGHAIAFPGGGSDNTGYSIYDGCYVEGYIDNGFYVSNSVGRKILKGCTAKNCGNSNIRVGDDDVVMSCRSVIDNASNVGYTSVGLNVESAANCNISGLEVVATDADNDVIRVMGSCRGLTMENVKVEIGSSVTMDIQGSTAGEGVTLENWVVDDTGGNSIQNTTLRIKRPDVTIRDCYINSSNKYCIQQVNDGSLTIEDSYLVTGNSHLLLGDGNTTTISDLTVRGTTFGGEGSGTGGFFLYSSDTVNRINVLDCDLSAVSNPKADVNGSVGEWCVVASQGIGDAFTDLNTVQWAAPEDDQSGIETAISALPSSGGTVMLKSGTYTLSSPVSVPSDTTICGQGYATEVHQSSEGDRAFVADTSDNVHFRDFRITGTGTNNTQGRGAITIGDISATGDGSLDCSVTRVAIENVSSTGITVSNNAGGVVVSDCWIDNPVEHGIYVSNTTRRCYVYGNTVQSAGVAGIKSSGATGTIIAFNDVQSPAGDGIVNDDNATGSITRNWITSPSSDGINVKASEVSVSENHITDAGSRGIIVYGNGTVYSNISITQNRVLRSAFSGIYLDTVHDSKVMGNFVKGSGYNSTDSYHNIRVSNNSDYNNVQVNTCRMKDDNSTPKYGIIVQTSDCDANLVTNNDLANSGSTGSLSDSGTGTVTTAGNRL